MAEGFSRVVADHTAGVRLDLETAASVLELEVSLARYLSPDMAHHSARSVFAVTDDSGVLCEVATTAGSRVVEQSDRSVAVADGGIVTIQLELEPASEARRVQVWLPHNSAVTIHSLRADRPVEAHAPAGSRWVHHGSSISHCLDAHGPLGAWPVLAARSLGLELTDLGLAGNSMLDPYVARTIRDLPADLITLKVGINIVNGDSFTERTLVPALHGFIDTVREGHPEVPFVVMSPVWCGIHEDTAGPTSFDPITMMCSALGTGDLTLARTREIVERVARARAAADARLFVLDGRELLSARDASHLWDGLHPDHEGYAIMADRFVSLARSGEGPVATALGLARR